MKKLPFLSSSFNLVILTLLLSLASYSGADEEIFESNIVVEGWEFTDEGEIPVLQFNPGPELESAIAEFRAKNIVIDDNGNTRFQLSRSTPFGPHTFASVNIVDLGDGRSRATMMYTETGEMVSFITSAGSQDLFAHQSLEASTLPLSKVEAGNDPAPQVPPPVACAITTAIFVAHCRRLCKDRGGVRSFFIGFCGLAGASCSCYQPIDMR